jgi:hypothetical protein
VITFPDPSSRFLLILYLWSISKSCWLWLPHLLDFPPASPTALVTPLGHSSSFWSDLPLLLFPATHLLLQIPLTRYYQNINCRMTSPGKAHLIASTWIYPEIHAAYFKL